LQDRITSKHLKKISDPKKYPTRRKHKKNRWKDMSIRCKISDLIPQTTSYNNQNNRRQK
jgi:hypothetical protein